MQPTLGGALILGVGSIAALLLFDAWLSHRNTRQLSEDSAWVAHSHEVLALTGDVLSTLKDAETGQRGFVITGEGRYLGTYHEALADFDGRMARLREATSDNPRQQSRIEEQGRVSAAKLAMLKEGIELRERHGFEAARAFISLGRSKAEMDAARRLVADMEAEERLLLAARSHRSERTRWVAAVTGPLAGWLGLAAVLGFAWLLRRHLDARRADAVVLHEQRELLRATLRSVGDGLISTDANGRVVSLNPIAEALTGWKTDEAQGLPLEAVFEIVHEDTRRTVENPSLRALIEGRIVGLANHTVLIARDGTQRPIEDSAAPIRREDGRISGSVLVFRDVSDRRRAEEEVRWRERQLQFVADHAPVLIAHCDAQHRYKFVNLPYAARFGLRPVDILGRTIPEFLGEEAYAPIKPYTEAALAGERVEFEVEMPYKDTGTQHMQCAYEPEVDAGGRVVGYVAAILNITDRRRVERALREAESRLSAIVDHSPATIFLKDRQGRYLLVNRRFEELARSLGVAGPYLGRRDAELLPPELAERFRRDDHEVLESKRARVFEESGEVAGKRRIALTTKFPLFDEAGGAYAVCGIRLDITERKRAEERLQVSEANASLALGVARMGTWGWEIASGVWDADARCRKICGFEPAAALTLAIVKSAVHHEDWPRVEAALLAALVPDGGGTYAEEFRFVHADASVRWVVSHGQAIHEGQGAARRTRRMVGTVLDITERKRAEERQRLLWEAAEVLLSTDDPDAMMRSLFDRIAPHFDLDAYFHFRVVEAGEVLRLVSCAGISEESAAGIGRVEFGQAVSGTAALRRRPIVLTHIQGSDDPMVRLLKSYGVRACACNPLLAGGTLLGTLSFASRRRDEFDAEELEFLRTVSHYVTYAHERLRLIEQLREADRRKDDFLATLAHELRNPLAPIRNSLFLMGHRVGEGDGQDHEAERAMAERQVTHLARLVDDLMDVARISKGKIELRKQVVELAPVVAHSVESARAAIEGRGLHLAVALPEGAVRLEADPTRMEQVLGNLLSNASKYTDPGGRITLTVERRGEEVEIRVADTGIGIEPGMLPRIFEMFAQVDSRSARSGGGLGIGLGLVRSLVEMHGGTITARSSGPGTGSEFVVRLPVHSTGPTSPRMIDDEQGRRAKVRRRRVLVVDDNADAANSLARLLTRLYGQEVRVSHDGALALEAAEEFRPEVVLLDIGMPEMDGYEVARRLRARPASRRTLLVALTGWGQPSDRSRSAEAGFDRHLVKPVDPDHLLELLAGVDDPQEGS